MYPMQPQRRPVFGGPQQPPPNQQAAPPLDRRARLAKAILDATGGGQPQEVNHPTQAIGNAMQAIAAARLDRQLKAPNPNPQMASGGGYMKPGPSARNQKPRPIFQRSTAIRPPKLGG